jgi:hypothetical protein
MPEPLYLQQIVPIPQPDVEEVLAIQQITYQFYEEVRSREAFEQHCLWYQQTSREHQRDLEMMRREINFFSWFNRRR